MCDLADRERKEGRMVGSYQELLPSPGGGGGGVAKPTPPRAASVPPSRPTTSTGSCPDRKKFDSPVGAEGRVSESVSCREGRSGAAAEGRERERGRGGPLATSYKV